MICRSKIVRFCLHYGNSPARQTLSVCLSVFLNELVSEGGLVYTTSRWTVDRTTHTLPFRLAKWLATRTHSHLHSHAHTFFSSPRSACHVKHAYAYTPSMVELGASHAVHLVMSSGDSHNPQFTTTTTSNSYSDDSSSNRVTGTTITQFNGKRRGKRKTGASKTQKQRTPGLVTATASLDCHCSSIDAEDGPSTTGQWSLMAGLCVSQRGFCFWCHHQRILRPHTHTSTHPPTSTALVDTKKRTRARVGERLEGKPRLSQANQQPRPRLQAARVCPMMDATIAQIGLASTPGLPKQANRGTLNSHEASNVPQHGKPVEAETRLSAPALPCFVARLDQAGWASWVPLTDLFLRVLTGGTQTQRLNSFLRFFLKNFDLFFLVFSFSFFLPLSGRSGLWVKAGPSYLWSKTQCILCCAAVLQERALRTTENGMEMEMVT